MSDPRNAANSGSRRDTASYRHSYHFCDVLHESGEKFARDSSESGLAIFDREWENIRKGQHWAASHLECNENAAILTSDYADGIEFVIGLRLHHADHLAWLNAALVAARTLGDPYSEGPHLGNMGKCHYLLGDYVSSLRRHQEHLSVSQKTGDTQNELNALNGCGACLLELGDYSAAFEYCERSLEMCREFDSRSNAVSVLTNLANVFHRVGDTASSIFYYQQTANLARSCGDNLGEGIALVNIANCNNELGRSDWALDFAGRALIIFREAGAPHYEGRTVRVMAEANHRLGQLDQALALAEEAADVLERCGDESGVQVARAYVAYWRGEGENPEPDAQRATVPMEAGFSINDRLDVWLDSLGIRETIEDNRSGS